MIKLGQFASIIRLTLIIINICYFLGFFVIIFCDVCLYHQSRHLSEMTEKELVSENTDNFIEAYGIMDKTNFQNIVMAIYYSFTTLSTVGFGDIHPKSDDERLGTIVILVGGVSIFSIFLGDFQNLLTRFNQLHADLGKNDKLDSFLMVLNHFNKETPLDQKMADDIRGLFQFRW